LTVIGKILVVRLSSIGDIILTTPLLRSLRKSFPGATITFLVKKQYEELLKDSPYIDKLLTFNQKEGMPGLKKIKEYLKDQKFDLYLDIHKNWRSRYLRFGLGAKVTTSYHKLIFRRTMLIWFKINFYQNIRHVYDRYFDSVKGFGIKYDGQGTEIHVSLEKQDKIKKMLSDKGYPFDKPLVILCPGATYFNKRWKPQGFVETARKLMVEKSAFIIVHGGPEDKALCDNIAASIGNGAIAMAGLLSLAESAALLRCAKLVIANDSGLLHMAQSQNVPVVGIYGATTRELGYFPVERKSTVVETKLACRPCTHNGLNKCPKKHFKCMNDITSDSVLKAALDYIP